MPLTPYVLAAALAVSAPTTPPADFAPGVAFDPRIPTLRQVLGHDPGEEITSPEGIVRYLTALHEAAPDRTRLIRYGGSWEGRPLFVLVVGAPERIASLDAIKTRPRTAGGPARASPPATAERLVKRAAGGRVADARRARQRDLLVGRGAGRGLPPAGGAGRPGGGRDPARDGGAHRPAAEPRRPRPLHRREPAGASRRSPIPSRPRAEHDEPWPGGRSNHYLFDMNRDWLALSQPETRGRVALCLRVVPAGRRRPARDGRRVHLLLRAAGRAGQPLHHGAPARVARRPSAARTPSASTRAGSPTSCARCSTRSTPATATRGRCSRAPSR